MYSLDNFSELQIYIANYLIEVPIWKYKWHPKMNMSKLSS